MFDAEALAILDTVAVPFSVNALVKSVGMSKPTVVSKIGHMQKLGLVTVTRRKIEHRPGRPFKIIKRTKLGNKVIELARQTELNSLRAYFAGRITLGIPESLAHYGVDMLIGRPSVVVPTKPEGKPSLVRPCVYEDKDFYERSKPTHDGLNVPTAEDLVVCMLKTRSDRLKVIPSLMAKNLQDLDLSYLLSKARFQRVLTPVAYLFNATARMNKKVRRALRSSAIARPHIEPTKLPNRSSRALPSLGEIRETYKMYVST